MINLYNNPVDCCGCSACVASCPKYAISMKRDDEGFLYPKVNPDLCVNCGICELVCPVKNQNEPRIPIIDFAAYNNDISIRNGSSSGGIFSALASRVISCGGIVFGAAFNDDFSVSHIGVEDIEGLAQLRGSKYLQSNIGDSYVKCKEALLRNRKVLFSGTPCQIAGLKRYLGKEYSNLLAVDCICHGVPSPGVWARYVDSIQKRYKEKISKISFRDKTTGWNSYCVSFYSNDACIKRIPHDQNVYMNLFLKDIILRPSCYGCPSKQGKSGGDITLADFWGVEHILPEIDDHKGISLVLANTEKGISFFDGINCTRIEVNHSTAISFNSSWHSFVSAHPKRKRFFRNYKRWRNFDRAAFLLLDSRPSISQRAFRFVKNNISRLLR